MITNLLKQKHDINESIIKKMRDDTDELIRLADAMAEAATNVHGHGYQTFINAREEFIKTIWDMNKDYVQIGKYFT